jgi:hypothetical protein
MGGWEGGGHLRRDPGSSWRGQEVLVLPVCSRRARAFGLYHGNEAAAEGPQAAKLGTVPFLMGLVEIGSPSTPGQVRHD